MHKAVNKVLYLKLFDVIKCYTERVLLHNAYNEVLLGTNSLTCVARQDSMAELYVSRE